MKQKSNKKKKLRLHWIKNKPKKNKTGEKQQQQQHKRRKEERKRKDIHNSTSLWYSGRIKAGALGYLLLKITYLWDQSSVSGNTLFTSGLNILFFIFLPRLFTFTCRYRVIPEPWRSVSERNTLDCWRAIQMISSGARKVALCSIMTTAAVYAQHISWVHRQRRAVDN